MLIVISIDGIEIQELSLLHKLINLLLKMLLYLILLRVCNSLNHVLNVSILKNGLKVVNKQDSNKLPMINQLKQVFLCSGKIGEKKFIMIRMVL